MSVHIVNTVLAATYDSPAQKLVMLSIANRADDDGANAWPKLDELATAAMCSERTVQRTLRALTDAGWIQIAAHAGGTRDRQREGRRPNLYRITPAGMVGRQSVTPVGRQNVTPVGRQIEPSWTTNPAELDDKAPSLTCDNKTDTSSSVHPSIPPPPEEAVRAAVDRLLDRAVDIEYAATSTQIGSTLGWRTSVRRRIARANEDHWRQALTADPDQPIAPLLAVALKRTEDEIRQRLHRIDISTARPPAAHPPHPARPVPRNTHPADCPGGCLGNQFVSCPTVLEVSA